MDISGKKKQLLFLFGFILLALIFASIILSGRIFAEDKDASTLLIQELPKDANILTDGSVTVDDISHPLSFEGERSNILSGRESLFAYESAYSLSAFLPTDSVTIANFVYQFPDKADAAEAAKILVQELQSASKSTKDLSVEPQEFSVESIETERSDVKGHAFLLPGGDGDVVYWLVARQNNTLSLVMANGFEPETVKSVFKSTIGSLGLTIDE